MCENIKKNDVDDLIWWIFNHRGLTEYLFKTAVEKQGFQQLFNNY